MVLEAVALCQRRLGLPAVRALHDDLLGVVAVDWVDADLHERALAATLAAGRREISLVDHLSFALMRRRRISRAFAFDAHFGEQGFDALPE